MTKLSDAELASMLPPSLADDETVLNLCKVLDTHLQELTEDISELLFLPNVDTISEELLDELAWQFHVDFYEYDAKVSAKRFSVKSAIYYHRIKGTPGIITLMLRQFYNTGTVQENWEYDGDAYCFRIVGIDEELNDEKTAQLSKLINMFKNARSHFDGFVITKKSTLQSYWGGICGTYRHHTIGG